MSILLLFPIFGLIAFLYSFCIVPLISAVTILSFLLLALGLACSSFPTGSLGYKFEIPLSIAVTEAPGFLALIKPYHAPLGGLHFASPNSTQHRPHKFTASQFQKTLPAPPLFCLSLFFIITFFKSSVSPFESRGDIN